MSIRIWCISYCFKSSEHFTILIRTTEFNNAKAIFLKILQVTIYHMTFILLLTRNNTTDLNLKKLSTFHTYYATSQNCILLGYIIKVKVCIFLCSSMVKIIVVNDGGELDMLPLCIHLVFMYLFYY